MFKKSINVILLVLESLFSLVFMTLCIMFVVSTCENISVQEKLKDFINKGVFEQEVNGDTRIYAVYTDEVVDDTIIIKPNSVELGTPGDIFIMPQSRVTNIFTVSGFITYLFGGHAGIVSYDATYNRNVLVEAMGATAEESYVYANYFGTEDYDLYKPEERTVYGLRVKGRTADFEKAYKYALTRVGYSYNYLYVLDTKDKYYCTDLCSRVYGAENDLNYNLNEDGLYVSTQDLYRSKDTYLTYFKYVDNGIIYIYYLKTR